MLPRKVAIVLTYNKRRQPLKHTMPKTLHLRLTPHKHTMLTTKKAGVLTEEPGMRWWSVKVSKRFNYSRDNNGTTIER